MATKKPVKKPAPKTKPTEKKPTREKAGRPPINEPTDAEAIQNKINTYFDNCEIQDIKPTFCGLALALDYSTRTQLWEHSRTKEAISVPIKKAMLKIEERYERGLGSNSPTGSIFALKNRGWTDKQGDDDGEKDNRLTIDFTE